MWITFDNINIKLLGFFNLHKVKVLSIYKSTLEKEPLKKFDYQIKDLLFFKCQRKFYCFLSRGELMNILYSDPWLYALVFIMSKKKGLCYSYCLNLP